MSVVHRQVRRALAERTVDTHEAFLCLRLCTFSLLKMFHVFLLIHVPPY